MVFRNVHGLPFCFKTVHWASGWVKLLMVTANSTLYLMKVRQLLWSHPRTKGQTNMKGSGIKLKTGSFQEYSSKQKNAEQTGVDFLYCNGRQTQVRVGSVRPECPLFHGVVEVMFTRWEPSPALCSTSRPGDQKWEEKPTSGGLRGNSIKIVEQTSCSNQHLGRRRKALTLKSDRFGFSCLLHTWP